jgi:HI0933-like protein
MFTHSYVFLNQIYKIKTVKNFLDKDLCNFDYILDVDGKTGGFNFQHAWTSGWQVAKALEMKEKV